jgi:hypothetical protein
MRETSFLFGDWNVKMCKARMQWFSKTCSQNPRFWCIFVKN